MVVPPTIRISLLGFVKEGSQRIFMGEIAQGIWLVTFRYQAQIL